MLTVQVLISECTTSSSTSVAGTVAIVDDKVIWEKKKVQFVKAVGAGTTSDTNATRCPKHDSVRDVLIMLTTPFLSLSDVGPNVEPAEIKIPGRAGRSDSEHLPLD